MRALSMYQPWASLVALGVKTVETRSWATKYRGRLLVHAAKRRAKFWDMKALVADIPEAWNAWYAAGLVSEDGATDAMPYGAVVASCVLTDCVPILAADAPTTEAWQKHVAPGRGDDRLRLWKGQDEYAACPSHTWSVEFVEDQRPFGDFTPGRFAWLLGDVKPTTERCPACWQIPGGPTAAFADYCDAVPGPPFVPACSTCGDQGACEPVPMRGRQGLWNPTWEAA